MGTSFRKPLRVLRAPAGGDYVDGVFVPAAAVQEFVSATVQPVSIGDMDRLQPLPEGRRADTMIRVYADTPLAVAGKDGAGDQVVWPEPGAVPGVPSRTYRVIARGDWQAGTICSHFRHIATTDAP